MRRLVSSTLGVLFVVALSTCSRERDSPSGTTTVTSANAEPIANATAVSRIADARCAREVTCENIGTGKRYPTIDVCTQKLHADMHDDLDVKDCPFGVTQTELEVCLAAIKSEDCNSALDRIERLTACRASDLCLTPRSRPPAP